MSKRNIFETFKDVSSSEKDLSDEDPEYQCSRSVAMIPIDLDLALAVGIISCYDTNRSRSSPSCRYHQIKKSHQV